MQKIVVVGISGTGKSTLSRLLAERLHLPLFHMDSLIWRPGWVEAPADAISIELAKIVEQRGWIVDGWIDTYCRPLLQAANTIIYLDYPGWLAALGGLQRWWTHRGQIRAEMSDGCVENFSSEYIGTMLHRKERPHIEATLNDVPNVRIVRVR